MTGSCWASRGPWPSLSCRCCAPGCSAGRGELRIPLPAGLVWGEAPGQILLHPDEAVRGAIGAVFGRFAAAGSARQTWLWLRENGLKLPSVRDGQLAWSTAAYPAVHKILTHP